MKPRIFHLTDFPEEYIYLKLKRNFTKKLFDKAIKKAGSQDKLAKKLGINHQQYISALRNHKNSFSLFVLKRILKFLKYKNLENVEKNMLFIKGLIHEHCLYNSKLPIKESPKLMKLLGHLIGDGYSGTYQSQANYYNIESEVREQFINCLKLFGNVPTTKTQNEIKFPRFITKILEHIYKVSFYTLKSRVPNILFKLPKNFSGEFLRGLCDDEAWIGDKKIEIYSQNKLLLKDVKRLLLKKFGIKTGNIQPHTRVYRIRIRSSYFETFYKYIGFDYPKKQNQLIFNIKLKSLKVRRGRINETKNNIIKFLEHSPLTTSQLSKKLFISESTIRDKHLKELKERGLVKVISKEGNSFVWGMGEDIGIRQPR